MSRRRRTNYGTPRCSGSRAARTGRPTKCTGDMRSDGARFSSGSGSSLVYRDALYITGAFQNRNLQATEFRRDVEVDLPDPPHHLFRIQFLA